MKALLKICLVSALVALPVCAYAQTGTEPKPASAMTCPMKGDMTDMQKNMGGMMSDMSGMINDTSDPAMKARMQKMHDQMSAMMAHMQQMNGKMSSGMMGGGMMQGGQNPSATPPATTDDHASHHTSP